MAMVRKSCLMRTTFWCMRPSLLGTTRPFPSLSSRSMPELRPKWRWCSSFMSSMQWSTLTSSVFSSINSLSRMQSLLKSKRSLMTRIRLWTNSMCSQTRLRRKSVSSSSSHLKCKGSRKSISASAHPLSSLYSSAWSLKSLSAFFSSPEYLSTCVFSWLKNSKTSVPTL